MVNYSNGKIYKIEPIVEHEEEEIYVGSTTKQYLSQRMDNHRRCFKSWKSGKTNKLTVFDLFDKYGIDNCKIYLLESVNANSKDELLAKEGHYIKTLKCVNRCIAGRTIKEYNNDNLDKIKHYRENNRDKMKNYLVQYRENNKNKIQAICICNICNCNYTKQNKKQHQKTQKHQDNLNNQN